MIGPTLSPEIGLKFKLKFSWIQKECHGALLENCARPQFTHTSPYPYTHTSLIYPYIALPVHPCTTRTPIHRPTRTPMHYPYTHTSPYPYTHALLVHPIMALPIHLCTTRTPIHRPTRTPPPVPPCGLSTDEEKVYGCMGRPCMGVWVGYLWVQKKCMGVWAGHVWVYG